MRLPLLLCTRATALCGARRALSQRPVQMGAQRPPALVTFDCTGTLFEATASVGFLYKAALVEAAGDGVHASAAMDLDSEALDVAFGLSYKEASERNPCFGAGVMNSDAWWLDVVSRTYSQAGVPAVVLKSLLPLAFDILYNRIYLSKGTWKLLPGVHESLRLLHEWRCRQPDGDRMALGVISNWDERLPRLLRELGISHYLDAIVTSQKVGTEKPAKEIFDFARNIVGVHSSARAVHVGDTFAKDVAGAVGADFEAVHLISDQELTKYSADDLAQMDLVPHTKLLCLSELPNLLGLELR